MSEHTLRSLLTAETPEIAGIPLPTSGPPGLYAAFVADRAALGLHAITNSQVGQLSVIVDGEAAADQGVDVVVAGLRYFLTVEFESPVERLCLSPECGEPRLGSRVATAHCTEHITRGANAAPRLDALVVEGRQQRQEAEAMIRLAEGLRETLSEAQLQ